MYLVENPEDMFYRDKAQVWTYKSTASEPTSTEVITMLEKTEPKKVRDHEFQPKFSNFRVKFDMTMIFSIISLVKTPLATI